MWRRYAIKATAFVDSPDVLSKAEIEKSGYVQNGQGRQVVYYDETDSTNNPGESGWVRNGEVPRYTRLWQIRQTCR